MKINGTRRWGNVAHVAKDRLLKAFNANDVKDEVVWEANFKIQSIDTNWWVLSAQKAMQSLQNYKLCKEVTQSLQKQITKQGS